MAAAERVTIALDGMGGDHAPDALVEGAVTAVRELGVQILLVGKSEELNAPPRFNGRTGRIEIVHASQVIEMAEHPANAVRQKTDSSMVVAVRLVKDGRAAAFVSAGIPAP